MTTEQKPAQPGANRVPRVLVPATLWLWRLTTSACARRSDPKLCQDQLGCARRWPLRAALQWSCLAPFRTSPLNERPVAGNQVLAAGSGGGIALIRRRKRPTKKHQGKPVTVFVRCHEPLLAMLDRYRRSESDVRTRAAALRRLGPLTTRNDARRIAANIVPRSRQCQPRSCAKSMPGEEIQNCAKISVREVGTRAPLAA
jgi:hypothetical protein